MKQQIFFILLILCFFSGCKEDSLELKEGHTVRLTGTLRVVGNEPFVEPVLTIENRDIYLKTESPTVNAFLYSRMGHQATVEGKVRIITLQTPNQRYKIQKVVLECENIEN